jgi:predicted acyltransferase
MTATETAVSPPPGATTSGRRLSVDALRGFDMFWIVGAHFLVSALAGWSRIPVLAAVNDQLSHVAWDGFRFYDLIFPLFVFITGVSSVFSLQKHVAKAGKAAATKRVLIRGATLFIAGLVYSGGMREPWPGLRILGVLNRIALAYSVAGLLFIWTPRKALPAQLAAILLGYWALMAWTPIRDIRLDKDAVAELSAKTGETDVHKLFLSVTNRVTGKYAPGYNLANHIDFQYLPGKLYDTYYDPEGILSTLPAVGSALIGVLAGLLLVRDDVGGTAKSLRLLAWGAALVALGWAWGREFPIVKKLWTSSFVCVTGGCSLGLLGAFHQIVDVWGFKRAVTPFIWIGANPLTIYFGSQILNFRKIAERFAGGELKQSLGAAGDPFLALVAVLILFAFARFLYKRQLFLRL